jgi:hypothetical protein
VINELLDGSSAPDGTSLHTQAGDRYAQRLRVVAVLVVSWACCAVLVTGIGRPALTAAGLLLSLVLPGWLLAEMILGRASAPVELWLAITMSVSLVVTLALGAIGAVAGDLSRSTLGWSWLAVSSLVGGASLLSSELAGRTDAT